MLKNPDAQAKVSFYPEGRHARQIEIRIEAEREEEAGIAAEQAAK